MKVGLFCDSRGGGIGPVLHEHYDTYEVYVYLRPGATFESILPIIEAYSERIDFTAIYIMVGNNNVTHLDRSTRKIHILEINPHEVYRNFSLALTDFQVRLMNILGGTPFLIMPLTPIAVNTYNKEFEPYCKQWILDMAMTKINDELVYQNLWKGLCTPLLQEVIYRSEGAGGHRTYYNRLTDGLHPTDATTRKWAHKIRRSLLLNGPI